MPSPASFPAEPDDGQPQQELAEFHRANLARASENQAQDPGDRKDKHRQAEDHDK